MSTYRVPLANGGRLEIYTGPMSDVLVAEGTGPINALARRGAAVASRAVRASGKRFVGMKPAKPFNLESRDIGRPSSPLAAELRVPVALVFNNSRFALEQEVGSLARVGTPERPLGQAFTAMRSESGVRGIRQEEIRAQVLFGTRSRASRAKKRGRR